MVSAWFKAPELMEGRQVKREKRDTWQRGAGVMGASKKPVEALDYSLAINTFNLMNKIVCVGNTLCSLH